MDQQEPRETKAALFSYKAPFPQRTVFSVLRFFNEAASTVQELRNSRMDLGLEKGENLRNITAMSKQHHTQRLTNAVHGANASLAPLSLKYNVTEFIHEGIPGHA